MMGAWLLIMACGSVRPVREDAPEATQGALVTLPAVRSCCRPFQCPRGDIRQTPSSPEKAMRRRLALKASDALVQELSDGVSS